MRIYKKIEAFCSFCSILIRPNAMKILYYLYHSPKKIVLYEDIQKATKVKQRILGRYMRLLKSYGLVNTFHDYGISKRGKVRTVSKCFLTKDEESLAIITKIIELYETIEIVLKKNNEE